MSVRGRESRGYKNVGSQIRFIVHRDELASTKPFQRNNQVNSNSLPSSDAYNVVEIDE
jgi:hypothetical protein